MGKKYFTEEERLEARRARQRRSYQNHKENRKKKALEYYYNTDYYSKHKDSIIEYQKEYQKEYKKEYKKTQMYRASRLLAGYKEADKDANRGECTITSDWIVERIFSQPCAHCGRTGWKIIGCNRLDNSKPHTPDNVEPCCFKCNLKELNKDMIRDEKGRFFGLK